jgi:hypothetical protein
MSTQSDNPKFRPHPLCAAIVSSFMFAMPTAAVLADSTAVDSKPLMLAGAHKACNPCAAKKGCNACAAKKWTCNPCAAKKGCNPCAAKASNPCAAKRGCNPCGAKGCNPGGGAKIKASAFKRPNGVAVAPSGNATLLAEGRALWNSTLLSSNGLSCQTCHQGYGNLNKTFAKPYPHWVAMPDQMSGVKEVTADEMVQFCMLAPMQGKTLGWNSTELAALTAYTVALQKGFNPCKATGAKGCNPCNPCAAKRGCNPCAAKKKKW